jgi:peroxiredoxin Q/BCP
VYGISPDSVESHIDFAKDHALNFPLLADTTHAVSEMFGAWVEKNMYGNKYMGVQRSTFVIAPDGKIEKVWEKVTPAGHATEVLAYLESK